MLGDQRVGYRPTLKSFDHILIPASNIGLPLARVHKLVGSTFADIDERDVFRDILRTHR